MEKNLTSIASEVNSTTFSIAQLRAEFSGQVIAPGDAHYEQARVVAYGSKDRQPAVILRPPTLLTCSAPSLWPEKPGWNWPFAPAATARPATAPRMAASYSA